MNKMYYVWAAFILLILIIVSIILYFYILLIDADARLATIKKQNKVVGTDLRINNNNTTNRCQVNSDCSPNEHCQDHVCVRECDNNQECSSGKSSNI